MRARPPHPTSVPDFKNALLQERSQIPINTLLNLVAFQEELKLFLVEKGGGTLYNTLQIKKVHKKCPITFGNIVDVIFFGN